MRSVPMFIVLGIVLAGCQARAARPDVPAHVNNPTAESRAELLRVVRDALNGSEVTLADDALTKDSLLIIEPKHLTGRDLRRPEHFRRMVSMRILKCNSPRPDTLNSSMVLVSSTFKEILESSSRSNRARKWRLVTYFPSFPA